MMFDADGYKLKAGALVTKTENGKDYLLLVYRNLWHDYSFPKGSIEDGETAQEAALREVLEETGITVEVADALPSQEYEYPNSGKVRVKMFLAKPKAGSSVEEKTDEKPVWVADEDVEKTLSYDDLKEYYREVRSKIYD
jgi:8-oxo-dGTP diphosphatase